MALWVCSGTDGCGTKYAVGLFRCPRCHNNEFHEDGDPMAKISRHSGASVAEPEPADDTAPAAEPEPQPEPVPDEAPEVEGGEGSSPGSSSSASTAAAAHQARETTGHAVEEEQINHLK